MHPYRIYLVDKDGHVLSPAQVIECADDQEASAQAVKLTKGKSSELWDGGRLVFRLPLDELERARNPCPRTRASRISGGQGRGEPKPTLADASE
jgi:hypothetical protein